MARYRILVSDPSQVSDQTIIAQFAPATVFKPRQVVWFIEYDGVSPYTPPSGCSIELDPGDTAFGQIAP